MKDDMRNAIPQTDEQAETNLRLCASGVTADSLIGLFHCYRQGRGMSILDAYEAVLLERVDGNSPRLKVLLGESQSEAQP